MLTTDLEATAGGSASVPQRPDGANGQTQGAGDTVSKHFAGLRDAALAARKTADELYQLAGLAPPPEAGVRDLRVIIVGLLCGKAWAREMAEAVPEIARQYREARAEERERKWEDEDDLPF